MKGVWATSTTTPGPGHRAHPADSQGPAGSGRPTITDVASAAGVSVATVSRALRNLPGVAEETRTRVVQAARRLGYVMAPMSVGRSFGAQACVAVVTPRLGTWFFSSLVASLAARLADFDLVCELHVLAAEADRSRFFACAPLSRRVRGVVVVGMTLTGQELASITSLRVPLVGVHSNLPRPCVQLDDGAMARCAVDHLIGLGHTRIAMICSVGGAGSDRAVPDRAVPDLACPDQAASGQAVSGQAASGQAASEETASGEALTGRAAVSHVVPRLRAAGYRRALREAGIEIDADLVLPGDDTAAGGARAMSALLARPHLPTAVFAHTDEMAFGAMTAVRGVGLDVPADVSVVAIDNSRLASAFRLTTVAQQVEEQGREAADLLVRALIPVADVGCLTVPGAPRAPRLVVRGSTAPPASRGAGGGGMRWSDVLPAG